MTYDVVIIGAGPAGLAAALYLLRAEKSVLLLEKGAVGGQITSSPKIENYPGIETASGNEIADRLVSQVLALGAELEIEEALGLEDRGEVKIVKTDGGEHAARAVIIAAGAKHRTLGLAGEEALVGEGISYCAVCDGAFYRDREVVVVGGGNSAKQEALLLSKICRRVTMVQNLSELTGEPRLSREVLAAGNIEVLFDSLVTAYLTDGGSFSGVKIRNEKTKEEREIAADGVFVAIGLEPDCRAFSPLIELDAGGYAVSDENCETKTPGVFVAGDCRTKRVRQIATAVADGVSAALGAAAYLDAR